MGRMDIGAAKAARPLFISVVIILAMVFCKAVQAAQSAPPDSAKETDFLFFANGETDLDGELFALFSRLDVKVNEPGLIHSLFSDISLDGAAEVRAFSSTITYLASNPVLITPLIWDFFTAFGEERGLVTFSNRLPSYILRAGETIAIVLACIAGLLIARGFVSQGGVILTAEPSKVIRNGVISYLIALALMLIFSLTVILLPLVILLLMLMAAMTVLGITSLALLVGLVASRSLNKSLRSWACFGLGLIPLAAIFNVPIINVAVGHIFVPILALGITITSLSDGVFRHRYFYAPFKSRKDENRRKIFNKDARTKLLGDK